MVTVAEVKREMPFMYHDAMVWPGDFDLVIDHPRYDFRLFGAPNMPVDDADYLLGLQASALIRDGGTLQIGTGVWATPSSIFAGCAISRTPFTRNC